MNHAALFNGIGGFQLAAEWLGWNNVLSVEIDKWCNKVTKQHFPDCMQYENIHNFDAKPYEGQIEIISGGFPCQPFSVAGKQRGKNDDRHLWPEMLRVIREARPTWVVGENVSGIINMALDEVIADLESEGYEVEPIIIPAVAANAPHRRDRVWIIAYSDSHGKDRDGSGLASLDKERHGEEEVQGRAVLGVGLEYANNEAASNADNIGIRCDQSRQRQIKLARSGWDSNWLQVATKLCRMDDGLPGPVDRNKRLKSLGNAIVPQIAYEIFKAIDDQARTIRNA